MENQARYNPESMKDSRLEEARLGWIKLLNTPITEADSKWPQAQWSDILFVEFSDREIDQDDKFHERQKIDIGDGQAHYIDQPSSWLLPLLTFWVRAAHTLPRDGETIDKYLTQFRRNVAKLKGGISRSVRRSGTKKWGYSVYTRSGYDFYDVEHEEYLPSDQQKMINEYVDTAVQLIEQYIDKMRTLPSERVPDSEVPPELLEQYPIPAEPDNETDNKNT